MNTKWTNSIKNKTTASVVLLTLCLLVLLSNYLDRLHTDKVKDSITTMYDDRLLVEEHILKMTRNVYQIREIILKSDNLKSQKIEISNLTNEFKEIYLQFTLTKLTVIEDATAKTLANELKNFESILQNELVINLEQTNKLLASLNTLSEIQIKESAIIMKDVESQYASIKTLSQFGLGIVFILLVVLQILVFSGKAVIPIYKPKNPSLN